VFERLHKIQDALAPLGLSDGYLLVLEQFHAQKWLKKWLNRVLCRLKNGDNSIKYANYGLIGGESKCIFIGEIGAGITPPSSRVGRTLLVSTGTAYRHITPSSESREGGLAYRGAVNLSESEITASTHVLHSGTHPYRSLPAHFLELIHPCPFLLWIEKEGNAIC
jgi:hypothetical protein